MLLLLTLACGDRDPQEIPEPTPAPVAPSTPQVVVPPGPAGLPAVADAVTGCTDLKPGTCVPSTVATVDGRDVWTGRFSIREEPYVKDAGRTCPWPDSAEWAAAKRGGFAPSRSAFQLRSPATDACSWSAEELEAEGITGSVWFGGDPKTQSSYADPGSGGVFSVNATVYYFWEDQPEPHGTACVDRGTENPVVPAFVQASTLNLRAKRSADSAVVGRVGIGQPIWVLGRSDTWAYVQLPDGGKESHAGNWLSPPLQDDMVGGEEWSCPAFGWVPAEFLGMAAPELSVLLAQADAHAQLGDAAAELTALQRAGALAPKDAAVLERLAAAYEASGDTERAERVRAQLTE
jgi:hypothetical protein